MCCRPTADRFEYLDSTIKMCTLLLKRCDECNGAMMLTLVRLNPAADSKVRLGIGSASVPVTVELQALPAGKLCDLVIAAVMLFRAGPKKNSDHLETSGNLDLSVYEIRLTETRMGAACPTE